MRSAWNRWLVLLALLLLLPAARAAITCTSITSPGVSINYVNGTTVSAQTFFTVTCTRSSPGDPTSVSYTVEAKNGGNPNGINNRATLGTATLRYDLYTTAGCGTQWKGNNLMSDTITWAAGATGAISKQTSFWGCITNPQTATSSGAYSDNVDVLLTYGNNITVPGTVGVTIYAPALCTMVSPPGNLTITYAAFGPQVARSTNFSVTCTKDMPYTIATDAPEGVLTGLRYLLTLSANASNGTGAPQTHAVTATFPAGQAGSCPSASCAATQPHVLTITY